MKKIILVILSIVAGSALYAVEDMDRLLVEKAETYAEKRAIHKYLLTEAKERREEAAKLRESAKVSRGGKASSQKSYKKEMIQEAVELEEEAQEFEDLAATIKLDSKDTAPAKKQ